MEVILAFIIATVIWFINTLISACVVLVVWSGFGPSVFHVNDISFWEAFCLCVAVRAMVTSGLSSGGD